MAINSNKLLLVREAVKIVVDTIPEALAPLRCVLRAKCANDSYDNSSWLPFPTLEKKPCLDTRGSIGGCQKGNWTIVEINTHTKYWQLSELGCRIMQFQSIPGSSILYINLFNGHGSYWMFTKKLKKKLIANEWKCLVQCNIVN